MSTSHIGKNHTDESIKKMSISQKGHTVLEKTRIKFKISILEIKEKYPTFAKVEEMRYDPDKLDEKIIQVHCKNHNCPNSKEQGGWFTPKSQQFDDRKRSIEHILGHDGYYFYCCDECKIECPLYNIKTDPFKVVKKLYTSEEYQTFRQQVLERENYICEYCEEPANTVHHIMPQKLEPIHALDPDYGVACCTKCHYKYGHKDECGTGVIANKICS